MADASGSDGGLADSLTNCSESIASAAQVYTPFHISVDPDDDPMYVSVGLSICLYMCMCLCMCLCMYV